MCRRDGPGLALLPRTVACAALWRPSTSDDESKAGGLRPDPPPPPPWGGPGRPWLQVLWRRQGGTSSLTGAGVAGRERLGSEDP